MVESCILGKGWKFLSDAMGVGLELLCMPAEQRVFLLLVPLAALK